MTKTENTVWQRYTYYLPFYLEGNLQTKLYGELRANQCLNYLRLQIYNSEGDDRRTYENKNSLRMSVSRTYTSLCKVQPGAGICTLTHNWTLVSYSIVTFILKSPCSIVMYLFACSSLVHSSHHHKHLSFPGVLSTFVCLMFFLSPGIVSQRKNLPLVLLPQQVDSVFSLHND